MRQSVYTFRQTRRRTHAAGSSGTGSPASRRDRYPFLFMVPALALYLIFVIAPAAAGMILAFTDWNSFDLLHPHFNGLDNFTNLLQAGNDMFVAIKNTLLYTVVTVVFKNVIALLAAVAVSSSLIRRKNGYRIAFYVPNMLSMVVVGVVFSSILNVSGFLNGALSAIGLGRFATDWLFNSHTAMYAISGVSIWKDLGFNMVIYLAAILAISQDFRDAASIDGAGRIAQFFHVTVPLIRAAITVNVILTFIWGLRVFDQVYVLTNGGPGNQTQVLLTMQFQLFGEGAWGLASAYNLLLTVAVGIGCAVLLAIIRKKEVQI